jgi:hypothetical protein
MTYTDPADRNWRDRQTNRFNAMRLAGYPVAGSFERQGAYDPSQGTVGGMRMPGMMTNRPTSVSFGGTAGRGGGLPGTFGGRPSIGGGATTQGGGKGLPGSLAAGDRYSTATRSRPGIGDVKRLSTAQPPSPAPASFSRSVQPDYGFTSQYDPLFDLVETVPEVARQFMGAASRGVLGPEGIQNIVSTGIDPARARTEKMTGDILSSIRQAEGRKATALARSMGGQFSGQPGRAAKAIAEGIISPSLGRQAGIAAGLKEEETGILNQLDLAHADLIRRNMESKMTGLAGLGQTTAQAAELVSRRIFDSTVTAFGFTPERLGDAKAKLAKKMAAWQIEINKMNAYWTTYFQNELEKARKDREGTDWFGALLGIGEIIGGIFTGNLALAGKGALDVVNTGNSAGGYGGLPEGDIYNPEDFYGG